MPCIITVIPRFWWMTLEAKSKFNICLFHLAKRFSSLNSKTGDTSIPQQRFPQGSKSWQELQQFSPRSELVLKPPKLEKVVSLVFGPGGMDPMRSPLTESAPSHTHTNTAGPHPADHGLDHEWLAQIFYGQPSSFPWRGLPAYDLAAAPAPKPVPHPRTWYQTGPPGSGSSSRAACLMVAHSNGSYILSLLPCSPELRAKYKWGISEPWSRALVEAPANLSSNLCLKMNQALFRQVIYSLCLGSFVYKMELLIVPASYGYYGINCEGCSWVSWTLSSSPTTFLVYRSYSVGSLSFLSRTQLPGAQLTLQGKKKKKKAWKFGLGI